MSNDVEFGCGIGAGIVEGLIPASFSVIRTIAVGCGSGGGNSSGGDDQRPL